MMICRLLWKVGGLIGWVGGWVGWLLDGWVGGWVGKLGGGRMVGSWVPYGFMPSVDFVVRTTSASVIQIQRKLLQLYLRREG